MGIKTGQFKTIKGDLITVNFTGENVKSGSLRLSSTPVVLQMDNGGRDYAPVQYTTASIACISDSVSLLDLFASKPLDIAVEIRSSVAGILFTGYISPNTYDQPIDGVNDTITIECVDWLGISKYVRYRQYKNEQLSTMTVREALLHTIGLITSSAELWLSNYVEIGYDDTTTSLYPELTLSESLFYNSPTQPTVLQNGDITLETQAMSCYEVLSMIAESFRGNFIQIGKVIVLYDVLSCIYSGTQRVYYNITCDDQVADIRIIGGIINITKKSFSSSGNTISILPKYSSFKLNYKQGNIDLYPNVFANDYLYVRGERIVDYTEGDIYNNNLKVHLVQLLHSRLLSITNRFADNKPNPEASTATTYNSSAMLLGCKTIEPRAAFTEDSPEFYTSWTDGWENYLRVYQAGVFSDSETQPDINNFVQIDVKKEFLVPSVATTSLSLYMKMELAVSKPQTEAEANVYSPKNLEKGYNNYLLYARIKCGENYYNKTSGTWTDEEGWNLLDFVGNGKEWKEGVFTASNIPINVIANSVKNGVVEISFRFYNKSVGQKPIITFVKSLEVKLVPSIFTNKAL